MSWIIWVLLCSFIFTIVAIIVDELDRARDEQPKPKKLPSPKTLPSPRFTVEIETVTIDIKQPEKRLPARMIERGWMDPITTADTVVRIYIRDTKQHYYTNRDAKPFAQVSLSDPEFDTKVQRAHAEAADRCSTLEALSQ